jgi:photosystem II stability/assembly factor-like uncharacterized protein
LYLIGVLFLAGCMGLPGTADQLDQVPTDTFAPTEAHPERTPIITEGEILDPSQTVQLKGTSPATSVVSDSSIATPVSTKSSFLSLPALSAGQPVTISYIDMIDAANGWAVGGEQDPGDRLLRTHDGGLTWQDVTPPYRSANENAAGNLKNAFFLDTTSAWVVVYYLPQSGPTEGFQQYFTTWRTQDGGLNWEVGEPIELYIALIGPVDSQIFDPSPPPLMQFLGAEHGWILIRDTRPGMFTYFAWMYTTRDGGQHWKKVFDPDNGLLQGGIKTGMTFADEETGWSTTELEPVGDPFFRHTSDGGNNWAELWLPLPEFDPDLVEPPWCGNQHSPHLFSPSFGMLVVDCMIPGETVQPADILYITADSGRNWRSYPYPGGALLMLNPRVGWALSREIYQTNDGGQTWEKIKTVSWDGQFDFVNARSGFAVARSEDRVALVRTFNAGQSWERLEPVLEP